MYLEGRPLAPLGTIRDTLLQSVWLRREQFRIFETLINVFASALSLDPKLTSKIESISEDYINLVIPGSTELKKKNEEAFIAKTASALNDVAALLAGYEGNKVTMNRKEG